MKNINDYKKRFYNLMESTMGDVRPLIFENEPISPIRPMTADEPISDEALNGFTDVGPTTYRNGTWKTYVKEDSDGGFYIVVMIDGDNARVVVEYGSDNIIVVEPYERYDGEFDMEVEDDGIFKISGMEDENLLKTIELAERKGRWYQAYQEYQNL
jgi:hypothetical protein